MVVVLNKLELEWFEKNHKESIQLVEKNKYTDTFSVTFKDDVSVTRIFIYGRQYQLERCYSNINTSQIQ